jgi:hypothetical protein
MIFWPRSIAFWSPLPKEGTKKFVCGPAFGALSFFNFGASRFFQFEVSLLAVLNSMGPALFGSRAKTGNI